MRKYRFIRYKMRILGSAFVFSSSMLFGLLLYFQSRKELRYAEELLGVMRRIRELICVKRAPIQTVFSKLSGQYLQQEGFFEKLGYALGKGSTFRHDTHPGTGKGVAEKQHAVALGDGAAFFVDLGAAELGLGVRRKRHGSSPLFVDIAVDVDRGHALGDEVVVERRRDRDAAVPSAGAADGNGEGVLAFFDVAGQQEADEVGELLHEGLGQILAGL